MNNNSKINSNKTNEWKFEEINTQGYVDWLNFTFRVI